MTVPNFKYEFEILIDKVYRLRPVTFTNAPKQIHVTGTGTVDILASIETPVSVNDPILTSGINDVNLNGLYTMSEVNYIQLTQNGAGTLKIILSGFQEPEVIEE